MSFNNLYFRLEQQQKWKLQSGKENKVTKKSNDNNTKLRGKNK